MSLRNALQMLSFRNKAASLVRSRKVYNLESARTVGFVCLLEDEQEWKDIQTAVNRFQQSGAKVRVLSFYPEKVKPLWYVETMNIVMCSLKEFGLMGIPKGKRVDEFMKDRFDILINLDLNGTFATNYVSVLSTAYFKVGIENQENRKFFDLLIKMENMDLKTYLEQVMFYLSVLKTN